MNWISVKERMPDYWGEFLTYHADGRILINNHNAEDAGFHMCSLSYSRDYKQQFIHPPTHWMPLPEPPKERDPICEFTEDLLAHQALQLDSKYLRKKVTDSKQIDKELNELQAYVDRCLNRLRNSEKE